MACRKYTKIYNEMWNFKLISCVYWTYTGLLYVSNSNQTTAYTYCLRESQSSCPFTSMCCCTVAVVKNLEALIPDYVIYPYLRLTWIFPSFVSILGHVHTVYKYISWDILVRYDMMPTSRNFICCRCGQLK